MIVTLTPNPSLDRTMVVDNLVRGAVNRAKQNWAEPAGKGVNISRALAASGIATTAVFPSGGSNGAEIARLLDAGGVEFIAVPIAGAVRSNVSVVEPNGTTTKLNEAGPTLAQDEVDALIEAALGASSSGGWVAASGSLAPGMAADFYYWLAQRLGAVGVKLAVDTSGDALRAALAGGPALVKPNRHELSELLDRPIGTLGHVVDAAIEVLQLGAEQVLVSLGPDGALLATGAGAVHGEVGVAQVRNTVGAGDALLAGFLAGGANDSGALANSLAWARAAVRSPLTSMAPPSESDTGAVVIHDRVDRSRLLEDDEAVASSTPPSVSGVRSAGSSGGTESQTENQ